MKKTNFDGFTVNLTLDEEGDWLAYLAEMPSVSAFGESMEKAVAQLELAWEGVKASFRKHGETAPVAPSRKNYSGRFNVRIDKRLHMALAVEASRVGVSLNALVAQKLAKSVKTLS